MLVDLQFIHTAVDA
jgi:parvulin-like peptidyl-prolyl isomerase